MYIYIHDVIMFNDVTIIPPYAKDEQKPSSQRILGDMIITCMATPYFNSVFLTNSFITELACK